MDFVPRSLAADFHNMTHFKFLSLNSLSLLRNKDFWNHENEYLKMLSFFKGRQIFVVLSTCQVSKRSN